MSNTKCSLFDFKPIIMYSHWAQSVSKVSFSVLNEFVSVSMNLTYVVLISFKNRRRNGYTLFPRFAVIRVTIVPYWPVTRNSVQDGGFQWIDRSLPECDVTYFGRYAGLLNFKVSPLHSSTRQNTYKADDGCSSLRWNVGTRQGQTSHKSKFKIQRFCGHDDVKSFMWFILQQKSATETDRWLVHWNFEK
jgi:hypothetical protein